MARFARGLALVLALALYPVLAMGQAAKGGKLDEAALRVKLLAGQTVEGKLIDVGGEGDDKQFKVQYVYQVRKPIPAGQKKLADIAARYNAALNIRSTGIEELKKLQAGLQDAYKAAYEVEETPIDLDFKAGKGVPVRTLLVPVDKDGQPRKLSAAEQKKLKGDPRYPGYIATADDLAEKPIVRVTIDRAKLKPTPKGEEAPPAPISMLVIIPPPAPPGWLDLKDPKPFVLPK